MNCTKYQEQISQFVDGELETRLQVELFRHLADCVPCQTLIDDSVRLKEDIRNERIPYPQELDDAILGQILRSHPGSAAVQGNNRRPESGWSRRVAVPLHLAVSIVIIIVVTGILLGRVLFPSEDSRRQPATTRADSAQMHPANFVYGIPPVEIYGARSAQDPGNPDRPKR
jgi:Putative zinc-finger